MIDELEKFLRTEVESRDKLTKRFKCRTTAATFRETSVIAAITTIELASIVTLTECVGMPLGIVLASTGLFLGLGTAVIHKTQKIFD